MRLIKPSYEILESEGLFKDIETAARTCYKSEDKITKNSCDKMVGSLIERGHNAMLEHGTVYLLIDDKTYTVLPLQKKYENNKYSKVKRGSMNEFIGECFVTTNYRVLVENGWLDDLKYKCEPTEFHEKRVSVRFICDRGVSHEFVRHRVFSFAQESTRYCNYSKDKFGNELTFIIPSWNNIAESEWTLDQVIQSSDNWEGNYGNIWMESVIRSELVYQSLLNKGWSPQQARSVLPNSLKTELIMTGFINDWKGFFKLRDATTAHPQAFELANPLHEEFKQLNLL